MSEQMEVEVVNGACRGAACNYYEDGGDGDDGVCIAQVFPGSITEARLWLADAAEAWIGGCEECNSFLDREGDFAEYAALAARREEAAAEMVAALTVLRAARCK